MILVGRDCFRVEEVIISYFYFSFRIGGVVREEIIGVEDLLI